MKVSADKDRYGQWLVQVLRITGPSSEKYIHGKKNHMWSSWNLHSFASPNYIIIICFQISSVEVNKYHDGFRAQF